MPDATYVGAGMPCGNCGNPLTPGQPHKCGRTPDFDRRLDESWEPSPAASPDERLREAGDALADAAHNALDPAGLSAAEKALELLHHREPHPLRSSAVREVVRAYLAALPVPSDTERGHIRRALQTLHDNGLLDVGTATGVAVGAAQHAAVAAGRAAATPDPPDEAAIRSDERERLSAMNALLSEQLEEARKWHLDAVKEKRAAQADAERLFTALDGYIMARITGTDLRDYDDLAERAARAHRSLAAADREKPEASDA